jgi:MYXO-CTERM domain-containing protein
MERVRWLRVIVTTMTIAACITYVHLSATEQHQVVVPASVSFGNQQINTTGTRSLTISPATGLNSDMLTAIAESCPAFAHAGTVPQTISSVCADGSGSGSDDGSGSGAECETFTTTSYTFNTTFTPTVVGLQSCTLQLTISGQVFAVTLSGTGVAPPIDVELETGATVATTSRCTSCVLDFGQTNVNTPATAQVLKVLNVGTGTGQLTAVTASPPFTVTGNTLPRSLGPNGTPSESFNVTCTPTQVGAVTSNLTVSTNDPKDPTLTVTLKCSGVMSDLVPDPNSLDLVTRVNDPSDPKTLTLRNQGTAALTITDVTFSSPEFSIVGPTPVGQSIAANGGSRTVAVSYLPTAPAASPVGKMFVEFDNVSTREVILNGPAFDTTMSLAPTAPPGTADVGVTCVGSTKRQRFTMLADSSGDFLLQKIEVLVGAQVYTVEPVTPATLPSVGAPHTLRGDGANVVEFDIAFSPEAPGIVPGAFSMTTDIPLASPFGVGLMGTGLPTGQNVTPTGPIDFGTIPTGGTSAEPQPISITNCTASPVTISRAEITGDPDFQIATTPELVIPANSTAVFGIVLSPEFGGAKRGQLELEYDGGSSAVTLIGNADGPLRPAPPDPTEPADPRDSYYRCSAGDASDSLLLGLAIAGMFGFRRRRHRR